MIAGSSARWASLCAIVLSVVWWSIAHQLVRAEEGNFDSKPSATSAFRRVFVPANSPEDWPVATDRYLPLSNEEFTRLVRQQSEKNKVRPDYVRIVSGTFQATLQPTDVLGVQASFEVRLEGDRSQLLPLSPLSLAIQSATWQSAQDSNCKLGLWSWQNRQLKPAVVVDESGTLLIAGMLGTEKSTVSRKDYHLETPAAVRQTLELQLPSNRTATVTNAELLSTDYGTLGESRWFFQLGPAQSHRIRIRSNQGVVQSLIKPRVSQTTSYQLKYSGLDALCELRFGAGLNRATELRATIPSGTQVVETTVNQQPVDWGLGDEPGDNILRVTVSPSDEPQVVQIRYLAKLRSGAAWDLPKLQFADVAWTEGTTQLFVSPEMELQSLVPQSSTLQLISGIDDSAGQGEIYRLQDWTQRAALEVVVARRQPNLVVRKMTRIETGQANSQATVATTLSSTRGEIYQFEAVVQPSWNIDSISAVPESALGDWHLDRSGDSTKLFLQLTEAVTKQQPLQIEVSARRAIGPLRFPADVSDLEVLRFLNTDEQTDLLALSTESSERLILAESLKKGLVNAEKWATSLPSSFDTSSMSEFDTLLDLSLLDADAVVAFSQQPPDYHAEVCVLVEALPDSISHHYEIDGNLRLGTLSELRIESTQPLPESLQWKVDGQTVTVVAKRITTNAQSQTPQGNAQYLLTFSEPLTEDFRLSAQHAHQCDSVETCNLLRLPDTKNWTELLTVRGSPAQFQLVDQTLTPSSQRSTSREQDSLPLLGVYQLEPQDFQQTSSLVSFRLHRQDSTPAAPQLVARLGEYQTLLGADGAALHSANFLLENLGEDSAKIVLPDGATLQEAWINDQQLEVQLLPSEGEAYEFRLPKESVWQHLGLKYSTRGSRLGGTAQIRPLPPKCSFPVTLNRWTLWAPEQYEIDDTQQNYSTTKYHWWKRIFGPLARARNEAIFDPTSGNRWQELWSTPLAVQESKSFSGSLASQLAEQIDAQPDETLSKVLGSLAKTNGLENSLLVDRSALIASGIDSGSLCSALSANRFPREQSVVGAKAISSCRLALLASPGAIVLTSQDRVAHWRNQLRPTRVSGVFIVNSDSLSDSLGRLRDANSTHFVSAATWADLPPAGEVPWKSPGSTTLADVGRQAETVEFAGTLPTLVVRRAHVHQALWYAVLLLTIVVGVWQLAHFPNVMIFVGAIAGACCLIVPAYWLTIPQAVFLGLLTAAVIRITLKSSQIGDEQQLVTLRNSTVAAAKFVVSAALLASPNVSHAADAVKFARVDSAKLPTVLVPVDAIGQRQGSDVFVPERFLYSLQKLSREATDPREFVFLNASYVASSQSAPPSSNASFTPVTVPWTLNYQIETFKPNCIVQLPLRRSEAIWLSSKHRLDGLPVTLSWQANGLGCTLSITDPGIHSLTLIGQPKPSTDEGANLLRLHIPAVPNAKLSLTTASGNSGIHILGAAQRSDASTSAQTEFLLGPTDAIEMRWKSQATTASADPWKQLVQSAWLKVHADSSRLDLHLSVMGCRTDLQAIEIDVAAPLQLLSTPQNLPIVDISTVANGPTTRITLRLQPGVPSEFVIPLSFELKRSTSIGEVRFPSVQVVGKDAGVNHFAVSVAAGLSYDEKVAENLRSIDPEEFLAAWNEATDEPLFAYSIEKNPNWSLQVRPDPQSSTEQQSLRLFCLPAVVKVEFDAEINQLSGAKLVHRLQVPNWLKIDAITVIDSAKQKVVASRWSRANSSEVSVFLSRPLSSLHMLTMNGHVERNEKDEIELPQIRLMDSEGGELHLDLYRSDEVQLNWAQPKWAPQEVESRGAPRDIEDIFVGHFFWRQSQNDQLSRLRLQRNDLRFNTQSVTTVEQGSAGWTAKLSSRVSVRRGVLSQLQLTLPGNFAPPFELLPEQVGAIRETSDTQGSTRLTVQLMSPVTQGSEVEIELRGNLMLPVDRSLEVPSLSWNNASKRDRYVQLPTLVNGETINWRRSGLKRRRLPLPLVELATPPVPSQSFRIQSDQFEAKQRLSEGVMRNAQVRLTRVSGFLEADGLFSGTAEILIQPGRASYCSIQLPEAAKLQRLVVGDQPRYTHAQADGSLRAALGPPFLPQRLLIKYQYPATKSGDGIRLVPPNILLGGQALPMPGAYWHVRTANNLIVGRPKVGQTVSPDEVVSRSYQVPLQMLQDAFSQILELAPNEGRAWTGTWQAIVDRAEQHLRETGSYPEEEVGFAADKEALLALEDAFAMEQSTTTANRRQLSYPPRIARALEATPTPADFYFVGNTAGQVHATISLSSRYSVWQWFAATLLVCGVLAVVLRLQNHPELYHDLCHWPHSLAVSGGIAWWLLLKPSALGMLVIVLAAISIALKKWKAQRDSTTSRQGTQFVSASN